MISALSNLVFQLTFAQFTFLRRSQIQPLAAIDDRDDRIPLVLGVDNMNAIASGRESLNGTAEPGCDLLEIDVFDDAKSVRAKNRRHASRLETADPTFI